MEKMDRKLKAGIVGCGYMGKIRKLIVEGIPNFELVGICETNPELLLEAGQAYRQYVAYQDMLKTDMDAVFVCTPNCFSPQIVVDSLNSGKHVFCEKPPGRGLNDIRQMIAAERANPGCKLMFGFNHRYHPGIIQAKKIVESGRFGKILFLKGTYGKSGGRNYLQSWRNDKEVAGGGILLDQGIHMLDLFRYFCGDFDDVKGFVNRMFWQANEIEDNAFVTLRNGTGQVAMLHSSATLWKHCFKLEIFLEGAYLIVTGLLSKTGSYGRETLTIGKRQFEDESFALGNPSEEVIYFDRDLSWNLEVEAWLDCILQNKPISNSSSLDALRVMEIIDKVYKDDGSFFSLKENGTYEKCSA
jgi:predicted dehydrogenase